MPSVRIYSSVVIGLEAIPIEVEVDAAPGLHSFTIVGLPDKSVEESKDRITAAIRNSGFIGPKQKNNRIIVNLAPADIRKEGSAFDLPIALGYLLATKQFECLHRSFLALGELSLDGTVRPISGVLPATAMAKTKKFAEIIVPIANAKEASVIPNIHVIGSASLLEVINHLRNQTVIKPQEPFDYVEHLKNNSEIGEFETDIADVKGQENAKRAMVIAASGGHNMMMSGPPGSGKTLLAKALPTIMPPLSLEEAIEVTKIYSIAGMNEGRALHTVRPFRNPHHTTSAVAIVGGGSFPRPGEISLAHRGVLFLDELPEFPRSVLESLRQPLENGSITIARAASSVVFPSRFLLMAAMNPCPCGNYGDDVLACTCTPNALGSYQRKLSGPLLDRIDLQVTVARETGEKLQSKNSVTSAHLRDSVIIARLAQSNRFYNKKIFTNAEMGPKDIEKYCPIDDPSRRLLNDAVKRYAISGRSYHKILKVARTIADLNKEREIKPAHIAEAMSYRIQKALEA